MLRQWGVATAGLRPLPDFLVLGTKRGGTTSLFHNLLTHPDVVRMFPERRLKSPMYFASHYGNGERWYRSHFATRPYRTVLGAARRRPTVTGDADPYYLYHPAVPQRVKSLMPEARLIVMLRDPVKRAYSHYWERVANGVETLDFEAALAAEPTRLAPELSRLDDPNHYSRPHDWFSYRDRGVYAPQLERWFAEFDRSQILIVASEDFYRDEQSVLDEVTRFLGIPRLPAAPRQHYNLRPAPEMNAATRAELSAFYAPHNERLYRLLDRDFGWS
jgi:hypothetical protein